MIKTKTLIKITFWPALLLAAFFLLFLSSSKQASAQTDTLECSSKVYLSQVNIVGPTTQLYTLDIDVDPITLTPIGTPQGLEYNTHGFRIQDGYLYGYHGFFASFVRINSAGVATLIGNGTTPAPTGGIGYAAGDIDGDGDHNMLEFKNALGVGNTNQWVITDVSGGAASTITDFVVTNDIPDADKGLAVGDIAYNPADGKFYGVDVRKNQAVVIDIDKSGGSGSVTHFGPVHSEFTGNHGGAFITSKGDLVTVQNDPGMAWVIDIGLNGSGTGEKTLLGETPATITNDASACPYVPLIEKIADPEEVEQGGVITYEYTIYNPIQTEDLTFDFEDILDEGFTYIADTLSDDLGGTPNNYGGTETLIIDNMTVPAGESAKITVDVAVASNVTPETYFNQACIDNFSASALVNEVCSDYPVTPVFGDKTPVTVLPPSAPDTGFAIFKNNPTYIMAVTSALALAIIVIAKKIRHRLSVK